MRPTTTPDPALPTLQGTGVPPQAVTEPSVMLDRTYFYLWHLPRKCVRGLDG